MHLAMAIAQLSPPLWSGLEELKTECSFSGGTYVLINVPVDGWAQVLRHLRAQLWSNSCRVNCIILLDTFIFQERSCEMTKITDLYFPRLISLLKCSSRFGKCDMLLFQTCDKQIDCVLWNWISLLPWRSLLWPNCIWSMHQWISSSIIIHYCDVIMGAVASQITSLTIVYSTVYSDTDKENVKAPRHWALCRD